MLDVRIERIVPRGFGIGFAEDLTVLVPLAAPGDVLRVRITEIRKRTAFAEIASVKEAGPHRIAPPCSYFGKCGGCDLQQLDYRAQLDAKAAIVTDCLRRIGKIELAEPVTIIPSPHVFEYRSRARWHVDPETRAIGYFKRGSHDVLDIEACPKLTPGLQSAFRFVRESIDWSAESQDTEIEAATGDEGQVSLHSAGRSEPPATLAFAAAGEKWAFSAAAFFQANKFLVPELIEAALGPDKGERAVDLYCGVGLFTLPLARRFHRVAGVEENPVAAEFARENARAIRAANVEIMTEPATRYLARKDLRDIDLLVLDPPRSGPESSVIERIAALRPRQISYVACEPSILARDLRILLDAGYRLGSVVALDLFPQTHHVETVARLSL